MAIFKQIQGTTETTKACLRVFRELWERELWFDDFNIETQQNIDRNIPKFPEDNYDLRTGYTHALELKDTAMKWAYELFTGDAYEYIDYQGKQLVVEKVNNGLNVIESTGVSERIIGQLNNIEEISSIVEANLLNDDIDFVIKE